MPLLETAPRAELAWTLGPSQVAQLLATDPERGLTADEASRRLAAIGPNELPTTVPPRWWRRLLGHLADPVVYLLLAAIAISLAAWVAEGASGLPLDAIVIAVIVVVNTTIGELQERRAEAALEALRAMTRNEATVVRDGATTRLAAAALVPGDVILLGSGDIVPADARIVEARALQAAEATLTGESAPVAKSIEAVPPEAALGDRIGMTHRGTIIVSGRGRAVVTRTGADTEVGRIATLLEATETEPTPLQTEIAQVGRTLGLAVLVIATVVVTTIVLLDDLRSTTEVVEALLIGVSLAVAAVPEGLPAVLSVVLALGVQRMSRRNALVKRLVSVEALGSATVICSDKTGTLTRNEMVVRRLLVPSAEIQLTGSGYDPTGRALTDAAEVTDDAVLDEARWALAVAELASDATTHVDGDRWVAVGDPTEAALVTARVKLGAGGGPGRLVRSDEIPFSSERQLMSTVNVGDGDRPLLAVKGAPDRVIGRCRWERRGGQPAPLDTDRRRWWDESVEALARRGLRTLAVSYRHLDTDDSTPRSEPTGPDGDPLERDLVLLGVVGIIDPPRVEAREAVDLARRAGIRVIMITGDHPGTARRIAADLGIGGDPPATVADGGERPVVTGPDLAAIDDDELRELTRTTSVYARVAPEQKLRIVRALLAQGEVVAVTGDGVNDAPALRAANIGVAMGVTGSDVAKETADMVLADDNFATIVAAVHEGRAIFHNIRSFLRYLLGSNIGEVLTVFLGVVGAGVIGLTDATTGGVSAPLLAVQILWINLVTDAGPALALGVDPPRADLMERRPRDPERPIIDRRMQLGIAVIGLTMALASLAMLDLKLPGGLLGGPWWGGGDLATARTAAFTVLVLAQLANTVNARSDTDSIREQLLMNRWLLAAVALSFALQVAVVHVPWLNEPFGTVALGVVDWLVAVALALSVTVVSEARKAALRWRDRRPRRSGSPVGANGPIGPSTVDLR